MRDVMSEVHATPIDDDHRRAVELVATMTAEEQYWVWLNPEDACRVGGILFRRTGGRHDDMLEAGVLETGFDGGICGCVAQVALRPKRHPAGTRALHRALSTDTTIVAVHSENEAGFNEPTGRVLTAAELEVYARYQCWIATNVPVRRSVEMFCYGADPDPVFPTARLRELHEAEVDG